MTNRRQVTGRTSLAALLLLAAGACSQAESDTPSDGADDGTSAVTSPATSSTPSPTEASDPDAPLTLDEAGAQTIDAQPFPDFTIAVGDRVWVTGVDEGLVAYDGASGEVVASTLVGEVVAGLDARDGRVYLAEELTGRPSLVVVDAASGKVIARTRLPVPAAEESTVAAGPRAAYALLRDGRLAVAAADGRRAGTMPAPGGATAVRFGFGSLWVPTSSGHVVRIDPATGERQARIAVGSAPRFLTVGHGAVWVMNQGDGSVTRIDPERNRVAATIEASETGISGGDIAVGAHGVWLHAAAVAAVLIDPQTNEVTHRVGVGLGSGGIAEASDNLWITAHDRFAIYRVPWPPPD